MADNPRCVFTVLFLHFFVFPLKFRHLLKIPGKIPNWQMWQILTWRTEVGKAVEFGIFYLFYFFGSTSQSFKMSTSSLKLKIPQIAVVNYAKNECLALTSTNYIFQMWSNYKKIVLIHRKKPINNVIRSGQLRIAEMWRASNPFCSHKYDDCPERISTAWLFITANLWNNS